MRYGLLGRHLGHSHSRTIHAMLGMTGYELFPTEPEAVEALLKREDIGGLNVTIPYKQTVMRFCDTLSETARRAGSVNTLVFHPGGRIAGHNTDYCGLLYMARQTGIALGGRKAVILGGGGAALTAALAIRDQGGEAVLLTRRGPDTFENAERHADAEILVNATPVGMFPGNDGMLLSPEAFPKLAGVLDLVYNPLRTRLVLEARGKGIPAVGGLAMLAEQGRAAAELFQNRTIPASETERVRRALERETENLVLVGMPGCGKTTVGKLAAALLGRPFLDTDAMVEAETGRTPAEWIRTEGEAAFREAESAALHRAARETGIVLAVGGGAVLREENRTALRQAGRVYLLQRPVEALAVAGRPLSRDLDALYARRRPAYEAAADAEIHAGTDPADAARRITEEFYAYFGS